MPNNQVDLIQHCHVLAKSIEDGAYKSLASIMLGIPSNVYKKVGGSQKYASFLIRFKNPLFIFFTFLPVAVIALIFSNPSSDWNRNLRDILALSLLLLLCSTIVIATDTISIKMLSTLRKNILNTFDNVEDIIDLQEWLSKVFSLKTQTIFTLLFGVVIGPISVLIWQSMRGGEFSTTFIISVIVGVQAIVFIPIFIAFLALPYQLSKYKLKLFAPDPSSSDAIAHLSSMTSSVLLILGLLFAIFNLWLLLFEIFENKLVLYGVSIGWVVLIATFIGIHNALSKIIKKVKRNSLNEIQAQIESLRAKEPEMNIKTLEHIDKLMKYHDQVKTTPNTALDFRALLALFNSLLLPSLSLILGNLNIF